MSRITAVPARKTAGRLGGAVALAGYAWIAGGFETFTWPARVSTFLAGVAVLGIALRLTRAEPPPIDRTGVLVWTSWIAAVTGWELWALFSMPRAAHPTISSLVSPLIDTQPGRACAILLWLGLGWWLARR